MKRGLTNNMILNSDADAGAALEVFDSLIHLLGAQIKYYKPFESESWKRAISFLKDYSTNKKPKTGVIVPDKYEKRARTALKFRAMGYAAAIEDSEIVFPDRQKVYADLEGRIMNMGGRFAVEHLFAELYYSKRFDRMILPKKPLMFNSLENQHPVVPYNYIIDVSLKHLASEGKPACQTDKYFEDTINMFSEFCYVDTSVYGSSFWDDIFRTDKDPIEYMRDLVFRESVFDIHQASLKFILKFNSYIVRNLECWKSAEAGVTPALFNGIAEFIARKGRRTRFTLLRTKSLKSKWFTPSQLKVVLDRISMPVDEFNKGFSGPKDYENVNFWNYPLARIDEDTVLLFPQLLAARCFLEALLEFYRSLEVPVDQMLGGLMEKFVEYLFAQKHITMNCGEYVYKKQKAEADGIVESSKRVTLIEMKKKTLIRSARAGVDYQILADLAQSLLSSQKQCFRTSCALRELPEVTFTKNGQSATVKLGGRRIDRISLVLFPFGDLQDRPLVHRIMDLFMKYSFTLNEATILRNNPETDIDRLRDVFDQMKKSVRSITDSVTLLAEHNPFFDSWFLDVEKLYHIIEESTGNESFAEVLGKTRCLTLGTHDFYNEHVARECRS